MYRNDSTIYVKDMNLVPEVGNGINPVPEAEWAEGQALDTLVFGRKCPIWKVTNSPLVEVEWNDDLSVLTLTTYENTGFSYFGVGQMEVWDFKEWLESGVVGNCRVEFRSPSEDGEWMETEFEEEVIGNAEFDSAMPAERFFYGWED